MNNDTSSFLLINVGAPFLIGLAVGYFIKKTLKVGLFLLGFSVVVLLVSSHYGFIEINGLNLTNTVEQGTGSINQFGSFLMNSLVGLGGVGLSGGAGFILGLKVG
jgi:uncharacterized membrane protein (Fun14 family)